MTCWPACTARTASSPRCTSATAPGVGKVVRTSLLAAIVGVHAFQGTRYTVAGEVPYGQGNHHPSICPYGLFHCADGLLQIAVGSESLWRRLAAEFDLPADDPRFATNADRVRNRDAVIAAVDAAFADAPARRPAAAAGRDRHPGRRGAHPGPGLRLGPDPVAGPARRRRARAGRPGHPARPAAAVRRRRAARRTPRRRRSASTTSRCARWLDEVDRGRGEQPRRARADRGGPRRGQLAAAGTSRCRPEPGSTRRTPRRWPRARERTGLDEAVVTGEGRIRGRGSPSSPASSASWPARSACGPPTGWSRAVERATDERLPLLASPTSGGTRMQEGTHRVPADGEDHRGDRAGTRPPATRTWSTCATRPPAACSPRGGRSGHVTVAEPGALIGFLGPAGLPRRCTAGSSRRACRPPRTCWRTASSTPCCRPSRSRRSWTGR